LELTAGDPLKSVDNKNATALARFRRRVALMIFPVTGQQSPGPEKAADYTQRFAVLQENGRLSAKLRKSAVLAGKSDVVSQALREQLSRGKLVFLSPATGCRGT